MDSLARLIIFSLAIIFVSSTYAVSEGQSPPHFVRQPPNKELLFTVETDKSDIRRPLIIECNAEGDPEPFYFWIKNGQRFDWTSQRDRIEQVHNKGTLIVNIPKPSDAGQYQCFAKNIWGIATSNSVFVHQAQLSSYKNQTQVVKQVTEGQSYHLTCEAPDGYPKPNYYWVTRDKSGLIAVINNSRITLDPTGTLWFSNITQQDDLKDSVYLCVASSYFINQIYTGSPIKLEVVPMNSASEQNKIAPVKQYTSGKNEIAVSQRRVSLYCIFGGTPLPTITWYVNGEPVQFNGNISSQNSGKIITINSITSADEANYTCQADNGGGDSISHTIALKVLAKPSFTKAPTSIIINENAAAVEFHCEATGNPTPEITWIHNGKPLSKAPFNPRRTVTFNSITIEQLQRNDSGNYGCNASNSLGYEYQEAYLNVLPLSPVITTFPRDGETIDGGEVKLRCRAVGWSKPRIIWTKNNTALPTYRFYTTENGDLSILGIYISDMGKYTCTAQNEISSVNATANVIVRHRTRITVAPSDTEVPAGKTVIFRCSVQADPSLELTVNWLRNGDPIDSSAEQQRIFQGNDNSLKIISTNKMDSGRYTCSAKTRLEEATADATLIVRDISKDLRSDE